MNKADTTSTRDNNNNNNNNNNKDDDDDVGWNKTLLTCPFVCNARPSAQGRKKSAHKMAAKDDPEDPPPQERAPFLSLEQETTTETNDSSSLENGLVLPKEDATKKPTDHNNTNFRIGSYMVVFFLAMIGHELALEAATTRFSQLDSVAYAVTLFQFAFCGLLPLAVSGGQALRRFPHSVRELVPYVRLSTVVFGATALASLSLQYVTYPTKVVFKSAKLIPTMMVATLLQGTRYGWMDYSAALLLCAGAAGYSYGSGHNNNDDNDNTIHGLVLLLVSILCDAFVPNLQQQFLSPPKALSATELMVNVNAVGLVGLVVYMGTMGYLQESVLACWDHPSLMVYLVLVGLGLSTAVLAYTKLIQASGSVVAVAVATLRKVATVVLSYVLFPKQLLTIHVLSGLLVLGGLVLSSVSKNYQNKKVLVRQ